MKDDLRGEQIMKLLKVDTLEQAREKLLAQITWDMGKDPCRKKRGKDPGL